jgi:hypothetical protein
LVESGDSWRLASIGDPRQWLNKLTGLIELTESTNQLNQLIP